ncbi:MAG: metallophosphoesterase family protein [Chloroflexota bacterium]|nr:MAG: YfcE family phosphodiesterase [Chloroflexota bacterium]
MRAVVLADTHMPRRARSLPPLLLAELETADVVFHLGDFTEEDLVRSLREFAPLYAVHGNQDSPEVQALFPSTHRLTLEGNLVVALIHGDVGGRTAVHAAHSLLREQPDVALVLFGHSHRAYLEWDNGTLLFNPGSPTDRRRAPSKTFGILEVGESLSASIVEIP